MIVAREEELGVGTRVWLHQQSGPITLPLQGQRIREMLSIQRTSLDEKASSLFLQQAIDNASLILSAFGPGIRILSLELEGLVNLWLELESTEEFDNLSVIRHFIQGKLANRFS